MCGKDIEKEQAKRRSNRSSVQVMEGFVFRQSNPAVVGASA